MYSNDPSSLSKQSRGEVNTPSADPGMWAGSFVAQLDAAEAEIAKQWDDVDMEEAEYVSKHAEYERSQNGSDVDGGRFLAIDTNILINHLSKVQRVFAIFSAQTGPSTPVLLIPTVVINELDNLASARNYDPTLPSDPPLTLSRARQATSWLLGINRWRRETGHGAIRCQRWTERGARAERDLRKADDRVLDCCLYFRENGAEGLMLWTEDRNLSLLAEANDIPTIPSPTPHISVILRICGISPSSVDLIPDNLEIDIDPDPSPGDLPATKRPLRDDHAQVDSDDMQIEPDVLFPHSDMDSPPQYTPISPSTTPTSRSAPSFASPPQPSLLSPSMHSLRPSPASKISSIPTNILARIDALIACMAYRLSQLSPTPPLDPTLQPSLRADTDPPSLTSTIASLAALIIALEALDAPASADTAPAMSVDSRRHLYRLVAALMRLSAWLRSACSTDTSIGGRYRLDGASRRITPGEAADALKNILEVFSEIGWDTDLEGYEDTIIAVKKL